MRRSQREALLANGRDSPTPTSSLRGKLFSEPHSTKHLTNGLAVTDSKLDEKNASSTSLPLPESSKTLYGTDVSQQVGCCA